MNVPVRLLAGRKGNVTQSGGIVTAAGAVRGPRPSIHDQAGTRQLVVNAKEALWGVEGAAGLGLEASAPPTSQADPR